MTEASQQLSIKESFYFGWTTFKENIFFFIKILLIIILFHTTAALIKEFIVGEDPLLDSILILIELLFQGVVTLGWIKLSLLFYDQHETKISDLFSQYSLVIKFILATLLYIIIVVLGLVLFIIPGIILGVKLAFFGQCMVDQNLGPIESLKRSWHLTKDNKLKTLAFFLILFLLSFLCIITIVGLIMIPIASIAPGFYYRSLLAQRENSLN